MKLRGNFARLEADKGGLVHMANKATMWIEDSDLDFSKRDPRDYTPKVNWLDEDSGFYTRMEWAKKFHTRVAKLKAEGKTPQTK